MTIVLNGTTGITNDGGYTGDGVVFADTTPANTLVTTTGGNVGVGTSSPGAKLQVSGGSTTEIRLISSGDLTAGAASFVRYGGSNNANSGYIGYGGAGSQIDLWNNLAGSIVFGTNAAERVRINSGGDFLVGTTSTVAGGGGHRAVIAFAGGVTQYGLGFRPAADNTVTATFSNAANGLVGSIYTTSSTTAFNTSSDYRLKNTIAPMTGALARVAALKPVTYKWNVDGSAGQGFIAHELAEVEPGCVTGEKDAVDAEGNPRYQGIDTSFLVATLTAAIQEQQAIITALTARVEALEGTQP
jgi:hypothetical protein